MDAALRSLRSRRLFERNERQQEAQAELLWLDAKLKAIDEKRKKLLVEKKQIRKRAEARS